jgi:hypothetical protein
MVDTPTFSPNPYANFDPSQWTNPYSQFYGRALPWPSSYAGQPTNALGQPIAAPPGMTLNQTPAQPQAPVQPQAPASAGFSPQQASAILQATGNWGINSTGGNGGAGGGVNNQNSIDAFNRLTAGYRPQPQQAAPQAASPAAANNWQQTLAMLANPGPVATPGATVPQAAPGGGQPSPGVLQNFLANWQPGSSGPGSGFTQNFNTILRGLQAQKGG